MDPKNAIADLPPCVFDRAGHAMVSASAAERDKVAARLGDAKNFRPCQWIESNASTVPLLAHETGFFCVMMAAMCVRGPGMICESAPIHRSAPAHEMVRGISHDRVERVGLHACHHFQTITMVDHRSALVAAAENSPLTCPGTAHHSSHGPSGWTWGANHTCASPDACVRTAGER